MSYIINQVRPTTTIVTFSEPEPPEIVNRLHDLIENIQISKVFSDDFQRHIKEWEKHFTKTFGQSFSSDYATLAIREIVTKASHHLIKSMQTSEAFSIDFQNYIKEWGEHFIRTFSQNNSSEYAAWAICELIVKVTHPILLSRPNHIKDDVNIFDNLLKKILSLILPPGEDAVKVLEFYEDCIDEKEIEEEKLKRTQEIREYNCILGNQETQKLVFDFELLKKRLLEEVKDQDSKRRALSEVLHSLSKEIDQSGQDLIKQAHIIQRLSEKFQIAQDTLFPIFAQISHAVQRYT